MVKCGKCGTMYKVLCHVCYPGPPSIEDNLRTEIGRLEHTERGYFRKVNELRTQLKAERKKRQRHVTEAMSWGRCQEVAISELREQLESRDAELEEIKEYGNALVVLARDFLPCCPATSKKMIDRAIEEGRKYRKKQKEDLALKLLKSLHDFCLLDGRILWIIGEVFNIDARAVCRAWGITYGVGPGLRPGAGSSGKGL